MPIITFILGEKKGADTEECQPLSATPCERCVRGLCPAEDALRDDGSTIREGLDGASNNPLAGPVLPEPDANEAAFPQDPAPPPPYSAARKPDKYALGRCWCCGLPNQICGRPLFCRAKYAPAHYLIDQDGARTWVPKSEDRPPACRAFNTLICPEDCPAELHWCSLCESYNHGAQECDKEFLHLGHGLFRTRSRFVDHTAAAGNGGGVADSATPATDAEELTRKGVADTMQQAPETPIPTNSALTPTGGSPIATIQTSDVSPATTAPLPQASLPWPDLVFVELFANHHPAPCYRLCEEVDTLTLWAFLLSIIHAAFVVAGLQGLNKQSDGLPTEYLREILALMNDSRATMNSTAAATLEPALVALEGLLVERQNVTDLAHDLNVGGDDLNVFWLAGLSLSLAALLVGMMCRQWLGELVLASRYANTAHNPAHGPNGSAYNTSLKFPAVMYFWVSVLVTSCAPALLHLASLLFVGGVVQVSWQQIWPMLFERGPSPVINHLPPTLLEHLPSADAVFAGVLPLAIELAIEVLHLGLNLHPRFLVDG
ncbi:hypothetical protein EV715DRAFT_288533 [Schizophyllum commune]